MDYVRLGSSGLKVSRLALGCMSYGAPTWRPWVLEEDAARPHFRRAIEAGINFFDTANVYSDGVSEQITGRAVREYGNRDEIVIASKVFGGPFDRPNMAGLNRKHIQQACEKSLRDLGVETIDLYQIHRLDPDTPPEEMLAALDDLVRAGKVRYIGASSMYAWEFGKLLSLSERNGWARMVSMQNHYNLLDRTEERDMLPLCAYEGVGVIPYSPLARGHLTGTRRGLGTGTTVRAESDSRNRMADGDVYDNTLDAVRAVAERHGRPMAQVALAWVLAQPVITAPIVGTTNLDQLDDAVAALDVELTDEDLAELAAPHPSVHPPSLGAPALRPSN